MDYRQERPVRPWLFTIAARVRIDELRKRRPIESTALDEESAAIVPSTVVTPEQHLDDQALAQEVQSALETLTEDQRLIVHLHRFEGMTFGEIGEILGISEGAAKLRAFRGYERLRKQLRPQAIGPQATDPQAQRPEKGSR